MEQAVNADHDDCEDSGLLRSDVTKEQLDNEMDEYWKDDEYEDAMDDTFDIQDQNLVEQQAMTRTVAKCSAGLTSQCEYVGPWFR